MGGLPWKTVIQPLLNIGNQPNHHAGYRPIYYKFLVLTDPAMASGQPIHLVGVEFSKLSRSVVGFEVETLLAP